MKTDFLETIPQISTKFGVQHYFDIFMSQGETSAYCPDITILNFI